MKDNLEDLFYNVSPRPPEYVGTGKQQLFAGVFAKIKNIVCIRKFAKIMDHIRLISTKILGKYKDHFFLPKKVPVVLYLSELHFSRSDFLQNPYFSGPYIFPKF